MPSTDSRLVREKPSIDHGLRVIRGTEDEEDRVARRVARMIPRLASLGPDELGQVERLLDSLRRA